MNRIRKALEGIPLPPEVEKILAEAEQKQRDDASYIQFLETQLKVSGKAQEQQPSPYRKQWEQNRDSAQGPRGARLEDVKERILVFLSKREEAEVVEVAHAAAVGTQVAQFHLDELHAHGLVKNYYASGSPVYWALDHNGRGYLIAHALIT